MRCSGKFLSVLCSLLMRRPCFSFVSFPVMAERMGTFHTKKVSLDFVRDHPSLISAVYQCARCRSPCPTLGTPLDAIREEEESKSPELCSPQQSGVSRVLAFAQPSGAEAAEQTIQLPPRDSVMAPAESLHVNEEPQAVCT